jgi:hypothetical protein
MLSSQSTRAAAQWDRLLFADMFQGATRACKSHLCGEESLWCVHGRSAAFNIVVWTEAKASCTHPQRAAALQPLQEQCSTVHAHELALSPVYYQTDSNSADSQEAVPPLSLVPRPIDGDAVASDPVHHRLSLERCCQVT